MSRPRLTTTTSSTVCATSDSTWLEISTVRPSAARRAEEVAQPADALRVEPVGRLVEHQRARVSQQRAGQAEPLAHAERVALHPPAAGAVQLDQLEHLVHPPGRAGRLRSRARGGGCAPCAPGGTAGPRARRRARAPGRSARGTGRPSTVAEPDVGIVRPSSVRRVVVLPAPLGPRKPSTRPGSALKLRPSTASVAPKRLVSESTSSIASPVRSSRARRTRAAPRAPPRCRPRAGGSRRSR